MKTSDRKRIHEGNVHLLEPGDRLRFRASEYHRDDWHGPREFEATVRGTILNSRFGPRICTIEKIDDDEEEGSFEDDFYLDDDWIIDLVQDCRDAHRPAEPSANARQDMAEVLYEVFPSVRPAFAEMLEKFVDALVDAGFHR